MIPNYSKNLKESIRELATINRAHRPTAEWFVSAHHGGLFFNHNWFHIGPVPWDISKQWIDLEKSIIISTDKASKTHLEFENHLNANWENAIECGVAGMTLALNSAGIITITSCRAHPKHSYAECPLVVLYSDKSRFPILKELLGRTNLLFVDSIDDELAYLIYAKDVLEMNAASLLLYENRELFKDLPRMLPDQEDIIKASEEYDKNINKSIELAMQSRNSGSLT